MEVKITNYGAIIVAIKTPDKDGRVDDIVLGHDTLEGYLNRSRYSARCVGAMRTGLRTGGSLSNGNSYSLAINNGEKPFARRVERVRQSRLAIRELSDGLLLTYRSPDGEEGYPETSKPPVEYALTSGNELRIEYRASTDKDTVINLTNHSYFNLAGGGTILGHELMINAEAFTPIDRGPDSDRRDSLGEKHADGFHVGNSPSARAFEDDYEQLQARGRL